MSDLGMRVHVSKRVLGVMLAVSAVILFVFGVLTVRHIEKHSNYTLVDARIVDVYDVHIDEDDKGGNHYMILSYSYDNEEYTARQKVFFSAESKIGTEVNVKCNPDNPEEIENTFILHIFVIFDIFFTIFTLFLIFAIIKGVPVDSFE